MQPLSKALPVDASGYPDSAPTEGRASTIDGEHIAMITTLDTNGDGVAHPGEFTLKLGSSTSSTSTSTSSSLWAGAGTVRVVQHVNYIQDSPKDG
jgi:hypothetical protein